MMTPNTAERGQGSPDTEAQFLTPFPNTLYRPKAPLPMGGGGGGVRGQFRQGGFRMGKISPPPGILNLAAIC